MEVDDTRTAPEIIAGNIVKKRQARGWTQSDLARRFPTVRSKQQVCVVEKGRKDMKVSTLQRFAGALDCTVEDLIDGVQPTPVERCSVAVE